MKRALLVVLLGGCFALPLQAGSKGFSPFVPIENDSAALDTSHWEIWQDNMGRFVKPIGGLHGGYWPGQRPYSLGHIFGAGLWVGVIDSTRTRGDTAVSWSYHTTNARSEFGPTTPDGNHNRYLDSLARLYNTKVPRDTAQWPERDSSGRAVISSDQELWTICNDLNPIYWLAPDSGIGIQVVRRSYAWCSPGPWGAIVKVEFDVKNVTGRWGGNPHSLSKVILGACVDADIGNESMPNDKCILGWTSGSACPNLVVQYQTAQEGGWALPPPYFAAFRCFVESPKATDTVKVKDDQFPHTILPGQPLGATAIKVYPIEKEPGSAFERYLYLRGMASLVDTNDAYGWVPGGPGPSDIRFLASCGPFSLPNDSTVRLSLHIIGGSDSADIWHKAELLGVESSTSPVSQRPSGVALYPCVPNPSSGSCLIRYALAEASPISLGVYDISGRLIRELDGGVIPPGVHSVFWDGRDGKGRPVSSGVYLFRLEAGRQCRFQRAVLIR
jgi:FlgD Ig-like domain